MTSRYCLLPLLGMLLVSTLVFPAGGKSDDALPTRVSLLQHAIGELVKLQEEGGEWPYEGVYRVRGRLPIGYRVGGTAIVADTLLQAAPDDATARAAALRGLAFVLKGLEDPLMAVSTEDAYDVRVWGHSYALEFLCRVRAAGAAGEHAKAVAAWIPKLVDILLQEEIRGGGWNYASRKRHASFVTAPVTQALLLARTQGEKVLDDVLARARTVLETCRQEDGAFLYSGTGTARSSGDKIPGSCARSAACETTLHLMGGGSVERIRAAVEAFHEHWEELHKRWQKTGTHVPPYMIAPYYFYYGHRHAAQAIESLPEAERQAQRDKLLKVILKTRDKDGTWNDRVFPRSRNYGTAMIVLALLGEKSLPPAKQAPK